MKARKRTINPFQVSTECTYPEGNPVNLKWVRGASRWNNGATRYGRSYRFHWFIATAKERSLRPTL